jgi:small-conductance mechanosensitive channel
MPFAVFSLSPLRRFLSLALLLLPVLAMAESSAATPRAATLSYMNRPIMVFRSELAALSPEQRVERALRRMQEAEQRSLSVITVAPLAMGELRGMGLFAGDLLLFTVLPGDVDPEESRDMQMLANTVRLRLDAAIAAYHTQRDPQLLGQSFLKLALAFALLIVAGWLVWHLRGWVTNRLQEIVLRRLHGAAPWVGYLAQVFERVVEIFGGMVLFALAYIWTTYALAQFPLTQPISQKLGHFLLALLEGFGGAIFSALPDLVALAVIVLITRALVHSLHALFNAVQEGRIQLPGLHRETLGATRRIVIGAIWALGFTFCYPYIPGSQSDVFKGLSVLLGFMLTLGSAGIVSQLMSGMTLIYSRALRRGDLVQVGDMVGVVEEIGTLSTKFINLYNEEITIPNAVLVGNQIRNLSCLHDTHGVWVGTKVTIGYDTPWRQVEAMLLNAAANVPALQSEPKAFVIQRALSDFYVEYEVLAVMRQPLDRALVLSQLHRQIQDEFNTHGVQIMSPNFRSQPEQAVLVRRENWYASPARVDGRE